MLSWDCLKEKSVTIEVYPESYRLKESLIIHSQIIYAINVKYSLMKITNIGELHIWLKAEESGKLRMPEAPSSLIMLSLLTQGFAWIPILWTQQIASL